MQDSLFTRIIKGEIPCHKIYEDSKTMAFLTIGPVNPGHTLVIPKTQVDHLWDLDDEDYQAVMSTSKKVANRIREILQPDRVLVHVAGFEVPHAHVHLVPAQDIEDVYKRPMEVSPPDEELAAMAAQLRMEDEL